MDDSERAAVRSSAIVLGGLALLSVLLGALSFALIEFVAFPGHAGDPESAAVSSLFEGSSLLWTASTRVVPVVAILAGGYLTARRDLPVTPCLAGALLGGLVAVVGHPLALALIVETPAFSYEPLVMSSLRWIGRFVVPVLLAVLLGGAVDGMRERGAAWRSTGS